MVLGFRMSGLQLKGLCLGGFRGCHPLPILELHIQTRECRGASAPSNLVGNDAEYLVTDTRGPTTSVSFLVDPKDM